MERLTAVYRRTFANQVAQQLELLARGAFFTWRAAMGAAQEPQLNLERAKASRGVIGAHVAGRLERVIPFFTTAALMGAFSTWRASVLASATAALADEDELADGGSGVGAASAIVSISAAAEAAEREAALRGYFAEQLQRLERRETACRAAFVMALAQDLESTVRGAFGYWRVVTNEGRKGKSADEAKAHVWQVREEFNRMTYGEGRSPHQLKLADMEALNAHRVEAQLATARAATCMSVLASQLSMQLELIVSSAFALWRAVACGGGSKAPTFDAIAAAEEAAASANEALDAACAYCAHLERREASLRKVLSAQLSHRLELLAHGAFLAWHAATMVPAATPAARQRMQTTSRSVLTALLENHNAILLHYACSAWRWAVATRSGVEEMALSTVAQAAELEARADHLERREAMCRGAFAAQLADRLELIIRGTFSSWLRHVLMSKAKETKVLMRAAFSAWLDAWLVKKVKSPKRSPKASDAALEASMRRELEEARLEALQLREELMQAKEEAALLKQKQLRDLGAAAGRDADASIALLSRHEEKLGKTSDIEDALSVVHVATLVQREASLRRMLATFMAGHLELTVRGAFQAWRFPTAVSTAATAAATAFAAAAGAVDTAAASAEGDGQGGDDISTAAWKLLEQREASCRRILANLLAGRLEACVRMAFFVWREAAIDSSPSQGTMPSSPAHHEVQLANLSHGLLARREASARCVVSFLIASQLESVALGAFGAWRAAVEVKAAAATASGSPTASRHGHGHSRHAGDSQHQDLDSKEESPDATLRLAFSVWFELAVARRAARVQRVVSAWRLVTTEKHKARLQRVVTAWRRITVEKAEVVASTRLVATQRREAAARAVLCAQIAGRLELVVRGAFDVWRAASQFALPVTA
eukprot:TRINITY_DN49151_c0_g1_i1.p1 TRINITY_DN49151_c0_g1~~TRINITY_DN49151_c0_g1_i1.p1  ORF type:complete len:889 (-),score=220.63 TRINITY_DN49151_c0_g1_i1:139-2805(-)